ncbi:hypothetical protein Tco_0248156 [Tanacetum coccineum]
MLTARKSVRSLPSHRLALMYSWSHSPSDHFSPGDFSSDTSSGSSSGYSSDTSSVPLAIPVARALSPVRADLLPPRRRNRGSVSTTAQDDSTEESYEAYTEPDINSDVHADIDADTVATEAAAAREAADRVEVDTRINRENEVKEESGSSHRGTVEIEVDTVVEPVVSEDTLVPTDDRSSREVVQIGQREIEQELHDYLEEIPIYNNL